MSAHLPPTELAALQNEEATERRKRRRLLLLVLLLLLLLGCILAALCRYLLTPAPLPELLPMPVNLNYPPHYLFSIYGVDQPVGITLSPQGDRLYVSESGGERLVKMFDRNGNLQGAFAPPATTFPLRSPVYLTTDSSGRVFVIDRLQQGVFVYTRDGDYIDTWLSADLTLSEYVSKHVGGLQAGAVFTYDVAAQQVFYQQPGQVTQTLPIPDAPTWSPLGISIDQADNLMVTDAAQNNNGVYLFPYGVVQAPSWQRFDSVPIRFGAYGQGDGEFLFPNDAVADATGRIFVVDGNNGRIQLWSQERVFQRNFGKGTGPSALNLPRGADIDERQRLYVVDAVGQNVKVFDIAAAEPVFLFTFGEGGLGDGQFNYPNDIVLDALGRLYVVDRENNRIQVWSY